MKKTIAVVLCLVLAIGMLAGCGTKDNGKVKITIGAWPAKEGEALDRMNGFKASFEEKYPQYEIVPSTWTFDRQQFYAKAAANQLPTLYNVGLTEMRSIIDEGYSVDVKPSLVEKGWYDQINPQMLEVIEEDGKVYAIPSKLSALGMAYNVNMYEAAGLMEADGTPKAPKTWDEVLQHAIKIKEATGKSGIAFATTNNSGGWLFTAFAWAYGVDFMEKDSDGKWKATFATPECTEALQYVKDLKWKYDVLPDNTLIDGSELYKLFAVGETAMVLSAENLNQRISPYETDINSVGMFGMPAGPKNHVALVTGGTYCISNGSTKEQVDGALAWLEFTGEVTPNLTDDTKSSLDSSYEIRQKNGDLIGIKQFSTWKEGAPYTDYLNGLIEDYSSVNENHYRLYNESLVNTDIELRTEEPVNCQELYGILDNCLQKVLSDKNADCAKILKEAEKQLQTNYLDKYGM